VPLRFCGVNPSRDCCIAFHHFSAQDMHIQRPSLSAHPQVMGAIQMNPQLELFVVGVEVAASAGAISTRRTSQSIRSGAASQSSTGAPVNGPPPEYRAPRGDLFRELFEWKRNASLAERPDQRTAEDERSDWYWRLHWHSVFEGRRKLKGPVDGLKRKVGRNRCAEFDVWLKRIGANGSNTSVRYRRLLVRIERDLGNLRTSFRYVPPSLSGSYDGAVRRVEAQLNTARSDVGELRTLLSDVAVLYRLLRKARLESACANLQVKSPAGGGLVE
jgi:hypothetical protein